MVSLLDIRRFFKGTIKLAEPLADYTSLGIGGTADYVFAPSSRDDLILLIAHLRESGSPFLLAGRGSNLLVSDQGYHGAVIMLEPGMSQIRLERTPSGEAFIHAAAGARLAALLDFAVEHSLQGVETLAGIPGTVGGLIAGGGEGARQLAWGRLAKVEIFRDADVLVVSEAPEKFVFRKSGTGRDVVLGATFRLEQGDKEQLMRLRRQALIRRNAEQPLNIPNAGVMFNDPPGRKASALVQEAGMKGVRRGGAVVSERNGNLLLNAGNAAAVDALALLRQVQRAVREKSGLQLALAMRLAGFEEESMREVA